jgi:murein L,D-transpeptidase YcbB/YkuD
VAGALRARLSGADSPDLTAVYAARGFRPLWVEESGPTPVARELAARLSAARDDGLDPADYDVAAIRRALPRSRSPAELAELEIALSRAYGRFAVDLRDPPSAAALVVTDPDVARARRSPARALAAASRTPSRLAMIRNLTPTNPVYQGLRAALAAHRAGKPSEAPFDAYEQTLALNLARARALPTDADGPFVLVDAASAQLWLYENGRPTLSMPVAVGKLSEPTPLMSGVIRYAVYHPYWNVPPDLARERFAPQVLARGPQALQAEGLEVLSDWTNEAQVIDPSTVDWQAVVDGRQTVRLRQKPGPGNMMGAVKLMLPNGFGVYLHDTPDRSVFTHSSRNFSAGCVRLSDARALARALGAPPPAVDGGTPEARVDLPAPVPVYIAYFTARPTNDGQIAFARDVYGRDTALMAQLSERRRPADAVEVAAR